MDIFDFWRVVGAKDHVHPADEEILSRVPHGYDLRCLPACFMGPLKTAPVVLLYLSPGWSPRDLEEAVSPEGQAYYSRRRLGYEPLPGPESSGWLWWSSRAKHIGHWQDLQSRIAILNIGAYHSKTFEDIPLLAALPSSRVSISWAQEVLFPEAIAGKRVVICLRSARFWGLHTRNAPYGESLFAPPVTRGGHMLKGEARDAVSEAAHRILKDSEIRPDG